MKSNVSKLLILACLLSMQLSPFSASAASGGSMVGGGGDVTILPDDTVVLADPWINTGAPQPNNMPPLREMNPRVLQLAGLYNDTVINLLKELSPDVSKSEIADEIKKLSKRESGLRFYAVQNASELNDFCASGGRKTYTLPKGQVVNQVACTSGDESFFVEPLFLKLSLRDQVLLLIHERLTTLRDKFGGKNYSAIARFTTGLGMYIDLYKKESEGIYPSLSIDQTDRLTNFFISIEEIQFRSSNPTANSFQWRAHSFGGGRIQSTSKVDSTSLVTLSSLVNKNSTIGKNSKIINTVLPVNFEVKNGATIEESILTNESGTRLTIGNYAIIKNAQLENLGLLTIGEESIITNSYIKTDGFVSGEKSSIVDSKFYGRLVLEQNVTIEQLYGEGTLRIKSDSKISYSKIYSYDLSIMNGVVISQSEITLKQKPEMIAEKQNMDLSVINDYWHENLYSNVPKALEFKGSYVFDREYECLKEDDGKIANVSNAVAEDGDFIKVDQSLKIIRTENNGHFKKTYFCSLTYTINTKYAKFSELGVNHIYLLQKNGELKPASPTLIKKENKLVTGINASTYEKDYFKASGAPILIEYGRVYLTPPQK